MISIKESPSKHIPGITSLKISIENIDKETFPYIIAELKKCVPFDYNKKTKIWEIAVTYLAQLIDSLYVYDDIDISIMKDKKESYEEFELMEYKTKPYDYQLEGIQYGLNHDNFLLLDPPGLGKTLQLIYLAEELKRREQLEHCLIICGLNTLKTNWAKEIQKHSSLDCRILGQKMTKNGKVKFGGITERLEELKNPIKEFFIITNIETIRDEKIVKALLKGPNKIDMIAVDEIHKAKSSSTAQGKHLLKLDKAKHKIGMTGTVIVNNPLDIYLPFKWLGVEKAAQSTCKKYYEYYGGAFGHEFLGYCNLDVLKQQIDKYTLRRDKSLLNLPEKTVVEEIVDMEESQRRFYNNIQDGVVDEVTKVTLKPNVVLSLAMRLRQATSCPSTLTDLNIPSAKIERAKELVEEIVSMGEKVVIFSTFKDTVRQLNDILQEYNPLLGYGDIPDAQISENTDMFQTDDEHKVFIGTWQKCGTGLTFTRASYMIFIDTPWTSSDLEQACDRIHRIGTKKPVTIYILITNDTIDERVAMIVNDKEAISSYLIDDEITEKGMDSLKRYIAELR